MTLPLAELAPTAGGAALTDILIGGAISAVYFILTVWVIVQERVRQRRTAVGRLVDAVGDRVGLPGWAAAPALLLPPFFLLAGWGVWWDVPLHMQRGRDEGAFANPSHYPIFLTLLAMLNIGLLVMALAKDPLPRHTFRLAPGWRVPMGSVVLTLAGIIGVVGFPLDDLWHRSFGQDVTEWGPTHVLMIGAAVTAPWCIPLLLAEARQTGARLMTGRWGRFVMTFGLAICVLPFAFLMEFELGVPQFPASTQGLLYSFILGFTCVAARIWGGKGGALVVGALWLVAHVFLVISTGLLPNVLTVKFLTAVPFVVIVELVALASAVDRRPGRRALFGVAAGLLGGSLGYYLELQWAGRYMPLPMPFNDHALPFLLLVSTLAGVAGGLLGLWQVRRIEEVAGVTPEGDQAPGGFRHVGLAGFAGFALLMAVFAPPLQGEVREAVVRYDDVSTGATECTEYEQQCLAHVTLSFKGADPVPESTWFYALAWQGYPRHAVEKTDDIPRDPVADVPGIIRTRMVATGQKGEYRSEAALPFYGEWKTLVRLHDNRGDMMAFPLYLPDDSAISGERGREVRVAEGATIGDQYEPHILQRERKSGIPAGLFAAANYAVLSLWIVVLLGFGACYNRAARRF